LKARLVSTIEANEEKYWLQSFCLHKFDLCRYVTALNPHISNVMKAASSAFRRSSSSAGKVQSIHNPRQSSGAASSRGGSAGDGAQRSSCGVGAFAFQGTNAHAIVVITAGRDAGGRAAGAGGGGACGLMFERKRHWPTPAFGSLWRTAPTASGRSPMVFHARPGRAQHAPIWQGWGTFHVILQSKHQLMTSSMAI
jgi:hypothetical protein